MKVFGASDTVTSVTLGFPLPPVVTNPRRAGASMHAIYAQASAKRRYSRTVTRICALHVSTIGRLPLPPSWLEYHLHVAGRMDDDGAVARTKWCTDAMVMAGFWPNDTPRWVRLKGIPEQTVHAVRPRKDEPKLDYIRRQWQRDQELGVIVTITPREQTLRSTAERRRHIVEVS